MISLVNYDAPTNEIYVVLIRLNVKIHVYMYIFCNPLLNSTNSNEETLETFCKIKMN